jgi:hypothetical protein
MDWAVGVKSLAYHPSVIIRTVSTRIAQSILAAGNDSDKKRSPGRGNSFLYSTSSIGAVGPI